MKAKARRSPHTFDIGPQHQHPKPPRRGGPPAGGLAGAMLGVFAVRAWSYVRRINVSGYVYGHVTPLAPRR